MSNWLTPDYKHLLSSCSKIILVIPCCWWLTIDFAWQNLHVSWLNPPYTPIIVGLTYRFHVYTHYYRNLFPAISTIQRFYPIWHLPSKHPNYILLFRQIFFVFLNCYFWWLLPHSCFYWWYKFFSGWNIMVVQNDLHLFWLLPHYSISQLYAWFLLHVHNTKRLQGLKEAAIVFSPPPIVASFAKRCVRSATLGGNQKKYRSILDG